MTNLTARLLRQYPYATYAGPVGLQRGRAYYRDGRVQEVELLDARTAVCIVEGDSGDYEVEIVANNTRGGLGFTCNCPYADEGHFCKHMVAAGLELADYLADEGEDLDPPLGAPTRAAPSTPARGWKKNLTHVLSLAPARAPAGRGQRYAGLLLLERQDLYPYSYGAPAAGNESYRLTPFVVAAQDWLPLAGGEGLTRAAINALLEADTTWIRSGKVLDRDLEPAKCLNLSADAVALLNMLMNMQRFYYYGQGLGQQTALLTLLTKLEAPLFKASSRNPKVEQRLRVQAEALDVALDVRATGAGLTLLLGIERDGRWEPVEGKVTVISRWPPWALVGSLLAPLRDTYTLDLLQAFPINVPAGEVEAFRAGFFANLAQKLPLRGDLVQWHDVRAVPVPRLYLRDGPERSLLADLRFAYGEHEVPAAKQPADFDVIPLPESWNLMRVHRDAEREATCLAHLASAAYGLKRADTRQPYGTLALRARIHPFDFLLRTVPQLAADGFEIYGEEQLKLGKINRSTPALRVSVSSGIDWFDLKAVIEFGELQVSLQEVRKALQRGQRFIRLADGSAGQIPEDWLEKYRHLWGLATQTEEGFRVHEAHLPLLDALLEDEAITEVPADLLERRERLRRFERITAQPLPAQFAGKLRPYQRHGVDWLYFLHNFNFGGLLADDMGLGKTVQVLAFLQSLKERAARPGQAATLLVVPKSLSANWQREAERFTPGLRILVYLGGGRSKETDQFDDYDVVLTTYGTMLRDSDSLRRYRFFYIILDESQAIKNPLSKSAKAARLLQAEHRLALTGTPVENNSLELWSQFAFINSGLLGGLDYFRQAFAVPIESRGDEAAAATLRSLVYPFILRRTKAQVAPELPPRTERVIYTDMDSAQQKLYARTRARYQAELLNLIETKGMHDARFKILEGLLRLRQIAIHPKLVDRAYKGEAPKLEVLLETLETLRAEGHKVLIFSQFVEVLKLVRRELETRDWQYVYLDGRTTNRQARVDQFQNDPAFPFFLISLKAGGVGLNLTAADYVIHLDPWWNPAVEMQASDRAHRIGQDKPVLVYKLIARDTVEEKILQLQEKKRALVQSLVTTEAGFFKALTKEEVKVLFA